MGTLGLAHPEKRDLTPFSFLDRSPERGVGAEALVRRCGVCGEVLAEEEIYYYEDCCNDCEGDW
jgi:hypothetical protein